MLYPWLSMIECPWYRTHDTVSVSMIQYQYPWYSISIHDTVSVSMIQYSVNMLQIVYVGYGYTRLYFIFHGTQYLSRVYVRVCLWFCVLWINPYQVSEEKRIFLKCDSHSKKSATAAPYNALSTGIHKCAKFQLDRICRSG